MIRVVGRPPVMWIEGMDAPEFLEAARKRRAQLERNAAWLEAHGDEVFAKYRGKCICVSGGELFTADNSLEALSLAEAANPEDDGRLLYQVPAEKAIRI